MERRGFTLIELFVTIAIIAMVGSVLLIQMGPMVKRYQRSYAVGKLERELNFSRRLSDAAHATVVFNIQDTAKGLKCNRKTDEPLNIKGIKRSLLIPHLHLVNKEAIVVTYYPSGVVDIDGKIKSCSILDCIPIASQEPIQN